MQILMGTDDMPDDMMMICPEGIEYSHHQCIHSLFRMNVTNCLSVYSMGTPVDSRGGGGG